VLVEPTPEAHREVGRFTAFDGKTWNPPAGRPPERVTVFLPRRNADSDCCSISSLLLLGVAHTRRELFHVLEHFLPSALEKRS